ncbi:MAG: hypothetical protein KAJ51_10035, partial [Thermoplasmata archaeon]|nr:hypothetical protein [Thermoplasmata archaeon]
MPKAKTTARSVRKKPGQVTQEEEVLFACPRCGSEIIDMSKGPEIGRCIKCKHIFEIETEESRRRKGKEAPHRIRRKSKLSTLFKKSPEIIDIDE